MGYEVHHAIVVSFWDIKILQATRRKAKELFKGTPVYVTPITPSANNMLRSYLVAPDGSKLGWDDSVKSAKARESFADYLKTYEPYPPDWALIQYGDDGGDDFMVDSNHINYNGKYPE